MSEPQPWVEPVPVAGWWTSSQSDTDQTVQVTGPEGYTENRPYAAVDLVKRAAQIAAAQAKLDAAMADAAAQLAQDMADNALSRAVTADGRITVADTDPTPLDADGKPEGALWEVRDGPTALRRFVLDDTGTWVPITIGQDFIGEDAIGQAQIMDLAVGTAQIAAAAITDAKVDILSAQKIDAVTFDGYEIRGAKIVSPSSLGEIELFENLLQIKRNTSGDGMQVTTSLGSPDASAADSFELYSAGSSVPGVLLSGDGQASVRRISADRVEVNGINVETRLKDLPQGIIGKMFGSQASWPTTGVGTSLYGIVKFRLAPARAGRQYRIRAKLKFENAGANTQLRLALKHSTGTVTVTSSNLDIAEYTINGARDTIEYDHVFTYSADTNREVLLAIQLLSGSLPLKLAWDVDGFLATHVTLEDLGKLDYALGDVSAQWTNAGGTPYAGGTAPPPVEQPKTYTGEWVASGVKSWRGNAETTDVLQHGTYGGVKRISQVVFDWSAITSALSGATINWVQIKLKNLHTYSSTGMTVSLKTSDHTSVVAGSTMPTITGSSVSVDIPRYYNSWFNLSTIFTASRRSVWLGVDAPSSLAYYGNFSRLAADCVLQINYTK